MFRLATLRYAGAASVFNRNVATENRFCTPVSLRHKMAFAAMEAADFAERIGGRGEAGGYAAFEV
jgi:hypothetical protein